jgi:hypothetical protein
LELIYGAFRDLLGLVKLFARLMKGSTKNYETKSKSRKGGVISEYKTFPWDGPALGNFLRFLWPGMIFYIVIREFSGIPHAKNAQNSIRVIKLNLPKKIWGLCFT